MSKKALAASLLCAGIAAGVLSPAADASDTLRIDIGSAAPEQGIPFPIEFIGEAQTIGEGNGPSLYAALRPAGGIGCQSTYQDDQAAAGGVTTILLPEEPFESPPSVGPGPYTQPITFKAPNTGSYLVCAWLQGSKNEALAGPAEASFTAGPPQVYQLSVGVPQPAVPNTAFQIDYTTHTDQQLTMYSDIRPAGGLPCAVNHVLDSEQNQSEAVLLNQDFSNGQEVFGGPATISATATEPAGPYTICTWIEGPNSTEVDASASTSIYVGTPPSPPAPPPSATVEAASPELALRTVVASKRHGTLVRGTTSDAVAGWLTVGESCGTSSVRSKARVLHGHFAIRLATPRRCRVGRRARVTARWPGSRGFVAQAVAIVVKVRR
jgi:hypothetical protein